MTLLDDPNATESLEGLAITASGLAALASAFLASPF